MTVTRDQVMGVLAGVTVPEGGSLVSRDMIRALTVEGGLIRFVIEAATPDDARALAPVQAQAETALRALAGVTSVQVVLTAHGPAATPAAPSLKIGQHPTPQQGGPQRITGVDRIIAVASGKGGVGKSTVSSNLAVALARQGRRVGLLDADIYGPSQPRMMGVSKRPASPDGKIIEPLHAHGVTMMSIGLMLKEDEAVIWRGPMLHKALEQFLTDVYWDEPDFLLIDMPPGTGDIALSLSQYLPRAEVYVVTTPQSAAQKVARLSAAMAAKVNLPVRGVIENMSWFTGDDGKRYEIFGSGGGEELAGELDVPLLARIPLVPTLREGGDDGRPIAAVDPDSEAGRAFHALAAEIATTLRPKKIFNAELKIS